MLEGGESGDPRRACASDGIQPARDSIQLYQPLLADPSAAGIDGEAGPRHAGVAFRLPLVTVRR